MHIKKIITCCSIVLTIIFMLSICAFIQKKGGMQSVVDKIAKSEKVNIRWKERVLNLLPSVDNKILFIGDSHLAIQPWSEYTSLEYSNRAVSGYKINEINIDIIKGTPSAVILSIGTNDIQAGYKQDHIINNLTQLLRNLKEKWPKNNFIYVVPPTPDADLYEKIIRPKYPRITRPSNVAINALANCAKKEGFNVLYAKSALVDGLHIDPSSAINIAKDIEKTLEKKRSSGQDEAPR